MYTGLVYDETYSICIPPMSRKKKLGRHCKNVVSGLLRYDFPANRVGGLRILWFSQVLCYYRYGLRL